MWVCEWWDLLLVCTFKGNSTTQATSQSLCRDWDPDTTKNRGPAQHPL